MFKRLMKLLVPSAAVLAAATPALAQFDAPVASNVRERVTGSLLRTNDGPQPEAGDQIAAFFGDRIVGRFVVGSDNTPVNQFAMLVYGDVPNTTAVEGVPVGQRVTVKFFDISANRVLDNARFENTAGEAFNYVYSGQQLPPIDLPGGIDLTPTRNLNVRLGVASGGGGGPTTPGTRGDVNGDGKINSDDAALILRAVVSGRTDISTTGTASAVSALNTTGTTGSPSGSGSNTTEQTGTNNTTGTGTANTASTAASRMDVNGDGRVTTDDAIAVLRL